MHASHINTHSTQVDTHVHTHAYEHNLYRVITDAESTMLQIHEIFELQGVF